MDSNATPRRRQSASDRLTRRKRVVIACEFCRVRKTRCDGVKPVCGFCQRHEARCVWNSASDETSGVDKGPAENEILSRLDEIKALLQNNATLQQTAPQPPASPVTVSSQARPSTLPAASPNPPSYPATRCESILQWPIFASVIEPADAAIESFALECALNSSHNISSSSGVIIQEHSLVPLCRKFLAHVHARNPILEGSELIQYAKSATENGLGWDGKSCLVLIACALACYTSPWEEAVTDQPSPITTEEHMESVASAEAFYVAAKKRMGLLGCSLVDIQCFFFASVYEKYIFSPLQAFLHIQQASIRIQTYLKRQQRLRMLHESNCADVSDQKLVQRAFWSIFKAESELLTELPLRSTGIENYVQNGSTFPTPPNIYAPASKADASTSTELQSWHEERSWFFYLAEISLRRTINDMLWLLYRKAESHWLDCNPSLERDHQETELQIAAWYTHLPDSIRFNPGELASNEYSFYLQGRFFEWQAYALRPFLYYALHLPPGQVLSQLTISYAQESLSVCATGIMYHHRHHRHGGTWFACRRSFAHALCILAAVIKADDSIRPPPDWGVLITTAIATLGRWEAQAGDVQAMRLTLERLSEAVCARKDGIS